MRELRQNDRHSSMQSIQRLADVTKTEREDCVRICDDIQRLVQKRRTKIQELLQQFQKQISGSTFVMNGSGSRKNDQVKTSPILQRKVRARYVFVVMSLCVCCYFQWPPSAINTGARCSSCSYKISHSCS